MSSSALEDVLRALEEGLRDAQQERRERALCSVCMEWPKAVIFYPCRHKVACTACSKELTACPVCRTTIDDRITPFD